MMMKLPFNQPNDKTCGQACLSIMTDQTIEYVIDWFKSDYGIYAEDCILYLAHHGIYLGSYAVPKVDEYFEVDNDYSFNIKWPVAGRPALLAVKSQRFVGKLHWVFWDGEKVFDPSPLVKRCKEISDYKIMEFWPLIPNDIVAKRFPIRIK